MSNEERYKEALERIVKTWGDALVGGKLVKQLKDIAREALNPPQEMVEVEVEVVRWLHKHRALYRETPPLEACKNDWIEMKGFDQRPVKPKVKRRKEITIPTLVYSSGTVPIYAKFYAEWEEDQ